MENKIVLKENVVYVTPTEEGVRFLEENDLRIRGYIVYDIVFEDKDSKKLTGVLVQGAPEGSLENLKYVKIYFGTNKQGESVTPFGVAYFEEGK